LGACVEGELGPRQRRRHTAHSRQGIANLTCTHSGGVVLVVPADIAVLVSPHHPWWSLGSFISICVKSGGCRSSGDLNIGRAPGRGKALCTRRLESESLHRNVARAVRTHAIECFDFQRVCLLNCCVDEERKRRRKGVREGLKVQRLALFQKTHKRHHMGIQTG
jgi:hypothetical protein